MSTQLKSRAHTNRRTLRKAVKRAIRALPNSPRKRARVISVIAEEHNISLTEKQFQQKERLNDEVRQFICKFYERDDISWQAPGKKDCISIYVDGIKLECQKRFLLYSLREAYAMYSEDILEQLDLVSFVASDRNMSALLATFHTIFSCVSITKMFACY